MPYAAAVIYEGMRMWPPVTPAVGLVSNSTSTAAWLITIVSHAARRHRDEEKCLRAGPAHW